jgi:hypothetical protein
MKTERAFARHRPRERYANAITVIATTSGSRWSLDLSLICTHSMTEVERSRPRLILSLLCYRTESHEKARFNTRLRRGGDVSRSVWHVCKSSSSSTCPEHLNDFFGTSNHHIHGPGGTDRGCGVDADNAPDAKVTVSCFDR